MHLSMVQSKPAISTQQRAHERFNVKVPGVLRMPDVQKGTYVITVLDASKTGMRVSCSIAIPSGTRVEVKAQGATLTGIARYARNVDREFNVGIEVDSINEQREEFDVAVLFRTARAGSVRPA